MDAGFPMAHHAGTAGELAPDDGHAWLPPLERLFGENFADCAPAGVSPFARVRVAEQQALFRQGAAARCVYLVHAGWFKIVRTGEDGYEQALDFCGPGDVLGCDALVGETHHNEAVALETAWAYALPIHDVQRLCHRFAAFNSRWQAAMASHITRAGEAAWVMAAVGAEKRTARFVIVLARRLGALGESNRRLRLRMCRRDIASHLGLAHESVSRSFSMLVEQKVLLVDNREIEIIDETALHRIAASTRGPAQAAAGTGPAARERAVAPVRVPKAAHARERVAVPALAA
jgi:CRP/FNR family transcriptional regulator